MDVLYNGLGPSAKMKAPKLGKLRGVQIRLDNFSGPLRKVGVETYF